MSWVLGEHQLFHSICSINAVDLSSCVESALDDAELVRCSTGVFVFWFLPSVALILLDNEKSSWGFFGRVNSTEIRLWTLQVYGFKPHLQC